MRTFVVVNRVEEIGYRQTTALLIAALARAGQEVFLSNVEDYSLDSTFSENKTQAISILARGTDFSSSRNCDSNFVESFVKSKPKFSTQALKNDDVILIRTSPGRDISRANIHASFLEICRAAKFNGIRVLNDPSHLKYFASKASLAIVNPKYRPALIVSNQSKLIANFVRKSQQDCVIKPLIGSRGENVIRVKSDTKNLEEIITNTFNGNGITAQHFVESDYPGDKRVVTLGGKILEINEYIAGANRQPAKGEFRANIHVGGKAHPLSLNKSERASAEYAAKLLDAHGIWLAGVDLIADKIIEFNVFSTGGLYDSEHFSKQSFCDEIVSRLTLE